ncbi:MAG TPA: DinB family protein [Chitinophagaceae bacterium]|nr:DinB family protein [Chitinophagaceae bacterium]
MNEKLHFLQVDYRDKLRAIPPTTTPLFGKMNVHQMIEHMTDSFQMATEKIKPVHEQADEITDKMKMFMMSEKPFRENTPNPLMSDQPLPTRCSTIEESLNELTTEIELFVKQFTNEPGKIVRNPFFGNLNFEEWVHLFYKHAHHHLRQFGVFDN